LSDFAVQLLKMSERTIVCPRCGSASIEQDEAQLVCIVCGTVLEESTIVSEIAFADTDTGSAVIGQFVGEHGKKVRGVPGYQRQSREITIQNGRRRIAQIAGALKLKGHHIEAAGRIFLLAVQHNFIQGRKTQNVVAACLYIICRREKTPHMLIDFSDVLQTNVYVLGHTYLKLCRVLNIQPPLIDPSLYIHRFAAQLEFGEKEQEVANTALRIVQRMKRDWIQTGRRPAGICGAGLLIAARLHGFRRTQKEIIHVVRICDVTLRKRLYEFGETPSSSLTPKEFDTIDLEAECDPPAFTRARLKENGKLPSNDKSIKQRDNVSEDENNSKHVTKKRKIETIKSTSKRKCKRLENNNTWKNTSDYRNDIPTMENIMNSLKTEEYEEGADILSHDEIEKEMVEALYSPDLEHLDPSKLNRPALSPLHFDDENAPSVPLSDKESSLADTLSKGTSLSCELTAHTSLDVQDDNAYNAKTAEKETFSDIDDEELNMYLNTPQEVELKTIVWNEVHKEYLDHLAEKERERLALVAEGKISSNDKKRRKKDENGSKPRQPTIKSQPATTAAQAVSEVLQKRVEKSAKINYTALRLRDLFEVDDDNDVRDANQNSNQKYSQEPTESSDNETKYCSQISFSL
jgi:transcription factor IIIB subunit 2